MKKSLSKVVDWSHQLVSEVLSQGNFAIDLTAGNGYDTLALAQLVGPEGQVLAFDLQQKALENSTRRLQENGVAVSYPTAPDSPRMAGVSLVHTSHENLAFWCDQPPQAVIANLGYLPGGDRTLVTQPESTVAALHAAADLLAPGGRIAVVIYAGHPGGRSEADAVEDFFKSLAEDKFEVLRLEIANRPQAPFLLVAGKL